MKLYACSHCQNPLYFENTACVVCGHAVGFDAESMALLTLIPGEGALFADRQRPDRSYRYCANQAYGVCNWLVPANAPGTFCRACSLNRVIPALTTEKAMASWLEIEEAKHRLIFSLFRLGLPVKRKTDGGTGILFDFRADSPGEEHVLTGHDNGLITLNVEEADEVARTRRKQDLGERYRTLLGHFRHEIGHYYWDVLIGNGPRLADFRCLFGDEHADYDEALKNYYQNGPPADWSGRFISPYATMHPWEDWAETWAHYLHLMDTLETAETFGIRIRPVEQVLARSIGAELLEDPYTIEDFRRILRMWLPLTFATNSLNRSMGHHDFYPFVISGPVTDKLQFIHQCCRAGVPEPSGR